MILSTFINKGIRGGATWRPGAMVFFGVFAVKRPWIAQPTAQAQGLEELYDCRRNSFERTEGTSPGGWRVLEGRCCHFDGYC